MSDYESYSKDSPKISTIAKQRTTVYLFQNRKICFTDITSDTFKVYLKLYRSGHSLNAIDRYEYTKAKYKQKPQIRGFESP
jgi:hypothetical protein